MGEGANKRAREKFDRFESCSAILSGIFERKTVVRKRPYKNLLSRSSQGGSPAHCIACWCFLGGKSEHVSGAYASAFDENLAKKV